MDKIPPAKKTYNGLFKNLFWRVVFCPTEFTGQVFRFIVFFGHAKEVENFVAPVCYVCLKFNNRTLDLCVQNRNTFVFPKKLFRGFITTKKCIHWTMPTVIFEFKSLPFIYIMHAIFCLVDFFQSKRKHLYKCLLY